MDAFTKGLLLKNLENFTKWEKRCSEKTRCSPIVFLIWTVQLHMFY